MDTNRRPEDGTHTSFWQAHSRCILVAAAVVLVAAAAAFLLTRTPADQAVDHITAVYVGDTAGDLEASRNAGTDFIYAAYGFGRLDAEKERVPVIRCLEELAELAK